VILAGQKSDISSHFVILISNSSIRPAVISERKVTREAWLEEHEVSDYPLPLALLGFVSH
jgi:hypothetical protein